MSVREGSESLGVANGLMGVSPAPLGDSSDEAAGGRLGAAGGALSVRLPLLLVPLLPVGRPRGCAAVVAAVVALGSGAENLWSPEAAGAAEAITGRAAAGAGGGGGGTGGGTTAAVTGEERCNGGTEGTENAADRMTGGPGDARPSTSTSSCSSCTARTDTRLCSCGGGGVGSAAACECVLSVDGKGRGDGLANCAEGLAGTSGLTRTLSCRCGAAVGDTLRLPSTDSRGALSTTGDGAACDSTGVPAAAVAVAGRGGAVGARCGEGDDAGATGALAAGTERFR